MFDVAFSELIVIAIIALVIIGPEKLPKVARTVGAITGRLQRYVSTIKTDIEREMQMEDLHELEQQIRQNARQIQTELNLDQPDAAEVAHDQKPQPPAQQ